MVALQFCWVGSGWVGLGPVGLGWVGLGGIGLGLSCCSLTHTVGDDCKYSTGTRSSRELDRAVSNIGFSMVSPTGLTDGSRKCRFMAPLIARMAAALLLLAAAGPRQSIAAVEAVDEGRLDSNGSGRMQQTRQ